MPPLYPVKLLFPEHTLTVEVPFDAIEAPAVHLGIRHWVQLRRGRPYPSREDLDVRQIGHALANMCLIQVIGSGADFLLRVVGDEVRRAYPAPLQGHLVSELAHDLPHTAKRWRDLFGAVVATGLPVAMKIRVGMDNPEVDFSVAEGVCLPLGTCDGVDYLITFASHTLELVEAGKAPDNSVSAHQ